MSYWGNKILLISFRWFHFDEWKLEMYMIEEKLDVYRNLDINELLFDGGKIPIKKPCEGMCLLYR